MRNVHGWTILLLLALFGSLPVFADDMQFDITGGLQYFGGVEKKSIAPSTGTMVRFGAGSGPKGVFRWLSSFTIVTASAQNTFDDAGTDRTLSYTYYAGEFNLGFKISPLIGLSKLPIQPYFGATGAIQSASFNFGTSATVSSTFPKSDSAVLAGYNLLVGTDISIGKEWGAQFHVEQAVISGTILKTTLSVGGNRFYFGLFFQ